MAIFQAFNAAGTGFNMSTTNSSGWAFVGANPSIVTDLVYDDGELAVFDVYGSYQIDSFSAIYWSNGYDIIVDELQYENYGSVVLSITGLNLYTTVDDLEANAWYVSLNRGNDTFYGNGYGDIIRAGRGQDKVYGYGGHDVIHGDAGKDSLYGQGGNDDLYGGSGRDYLNGGRGSDYLNGGTGADILKGGAGADYFVFDTPLSYGNIDRIVDFNPYVDTIVLDMDVFTWIDFEGALPDSAFTIDYEAWNPYNRIIYDDWTGALLYDPDGSGYAPAFQFAQLRPGLALTADNFYIV